MKLTAVIAAVVLLSSFTAAHVKPLKTLPGTIAGSWCFTEQDKSNVSFYSRGKCAADRNGIEVSADNYSGAHYSCIIHRVEPLDNGSTGKEAYFVHANCVNDETGASRYKDNSMFQLIGGQLIITPNFTKKDANWRAKP